MKRLIIALLFATAFLPMLIAQTESETDIVQPETAFAYEPIRKGDQYMRVGIGAGIPLFNLGPDGVNTKTNMFVGGTGILGYSNFITSRIALGGEIAFAYNTTLGENLYFYLPITFKATYVFVLNRIQIPLSLSTGVVFQTYNITNYFGPILKPEAAVYYQYNPEWSFGVTAGWNVIPQWYEESENNRTGNIADVTVGFRYHF